MPARRVGRERIGSLWSGEEGAYRGPGPGAWRDDAPRPRAQAPPDPVQHLPGRFGLGGPGT